MAKTTYRFNGQSKADMLSKFEIALFPAAEGCLHAQFGVGTDISICHVA